MTEDQKKVLEMVRNAIHHEPDTSKEKMKVRFVKVMEEEMEQRKAVEERLDSMKAIDAFYEAKEKTDENPFLFTCPYCGGEAKGGYVEDNGHIRIQCTNCGFRLME